jgi:hypothetical protein
MLRHTAPFVVGEARLSDSDSLFCTVVSCAKDKEKPPEAEAAEVRKRGLKAGVGQIALTHL